jgi:hypothetical protein
MPNANYTAELNRHFMQQICAKTDRLQLHNIPLLSPAQTTTPYARPT